MGTGLVRARSSCSRGLKRRLCAAVTLLCYVCATVGMSMGTATDSPGFGCRCDPELQRTGNCCCSKNKQTSQQSAETPSCCTSSARPACCAGRASAVPVRPTCCQQPEVAVPRGACCTSRADLREARDHAEERSVPEFRTACGCGHEPISGFLLNADPRLLEQSCSVAGGVLWGELRETPPTGCDRVDVLETPPPERMPS